MRWTKYTPPPAGFDLSESALVPDDRTQLNDTGAIRAGVPILHNDSDFNAISRHTELQIDV